MELLVEMELKEALQGEDSTFTIALMEQVMTTEVEEQAMSADDLFAELGI